jgi:hypothetical protein
VEYQTVTLPLVRNKDNYDFTYNRYGHHGNMSIYLVGTEDTTRKNLNTSNAIQNPKESDFSDFYKMFMNELDNLLD